MPLILAMLAGSVLAADEATPHPWLVGSWVHDGGAELWVPAGDALIGLGVWAKGGHATGFEVLGIGRGRDGVAAYVAMPRGREYVAFPVISAKKGKLRAENRGHDFPQTFLYRRRGDHLAIEVGGGPDAEGFKLDLELRPSPDATALIDADNAFAAAVATGGLDAWMDAWAPDGIRWAPGAEVGLEAVRASSAPLFADPSARFTWTPTAGELAPTGDLGLTVGTWTYALDGAPPEETATGRYVTVWRRQADGSWKVAFDASVPLPPDRTE